MCLNADVSTRLLGHDRSSRKWADPSNVDAVRVKCHRSTDWSGCQTSLIPSRIAISYRRIPSRSENRRQSSRTQSLGSGKLYNLLTITNDDFVSKTIRYSPMNSFIGMRKTSRVIDCMTVRKYRYVDS